MNELINKIILIENEENRRSQNKLSLYNKGEKIHRKQMEFHQCLAANRWVFGGNRTGKTECGAVETVWLARGIHPFRKNRKNISCWVVSLSAQVQRDVAQAKILDYCPIDYYLNGIKIGSQEVFFNSFAPTTANYVFYLKAEMGENVVSVVATHTNSITGAATLTVKGANISAYNETPTLDYYALGKCYCVFKNGTFVFYKTSLSSPISTFDLVSLNIDKIKLYESDNSKMFYISNGNLYLTNFNETTIPEGILLAENVADFCYFYYYKVLFTIKGGALYKQTLNMDSPTMTEAVLIETGEFKRAYKIFLTYYGAKAYIAVDSPSGVLLYLYNGSMNYLSKADIQNPVDIRVNSTRVSVLSLEAGNLKETAFILSDIINPVTNTLYANIDAACYLSDANYFAMQGDKLITF